MTSSKAAFIGTALIFVLFLPYLYLSRYDLEIFRTSNDATTYSKEDASCNDSFRFPRWGEEGIHFDHLMKFLFENLHQTASTVQSVKSRSRFPEVLYVVDSEGVWVSNLLAQRSTWKQMLSHRREPTEQLFTLAWKILQGSDGIRWRYLRRLLPNNGFPFLAWYGDYKSCNYNNWENAYSIPLFTTCAPISCSHAFPIPNYQNRVSAKPNSPEWDRVQTNYNSRYPSSSKIQKLVWRGSLSARNEDWNSTRWRVMVQAHQEADDRIDMGFVSIGNINAGIQKEIDWSLIGGALKKAISPMEDFQKYSAILDMDGNSWSSRFSELLCYNSVIVKIEPEYVEYFYRDLFPWKHYIPIAANLSDWNETLDYLFDPRNEETIQTIVQNANRWCSQHLTLNSLATSMLDVWENYVSYMYKGNSAWETKWTKYKSRIFNSEFDMVRL